MASKRTESEKTAHVGLGNTSANHQAHAQTSITGIKAGKRVHGTTLQQKRRFYTTRSISQQAIDLQNEPITNEPNLHTHATDNQQTYVSFPPPVSRDYKYAKRELLHRPLGGIETMYNMYTSQGTDIICLMTKVETVYPVTPSAVKKALHMSHQRHPLLRMVIKESQIYTDHHLDFVENEKGTCDFAVSERTDWIQFMLEELERPFDGSQSLIRYRMLNSTTSRKSTENSEYEVKDVNESANEVKDVNEPAKENGKENSENYFKYQAMFLFIMNHSIMDGGYSLWMFQEFINFLDAVSMGMDIRGVRQLPLLPPFEDIFTFTCNRTPANDKGCNGNTLSFCHNSTNDTLLKAYNEAFQNDIDISPHKKLRNGCLVFKFSKMKTRTFVSATKSHMCSPKGAITAACVLAMLELVYENKLTEMVKSFAMPIEYMTDFRRVGEFQISDDSVPHYPGVATLHIPLLANLQLEGTQITTNAFWKIAEQFGDCLDKHIDSPEVYDWIKAEAAKYNRVPAHPEQPGKSLYVLSISNMGKLDGVLNSDVSSRVRLTDLHGHSSILVHDMPIFSITTFALNGHLCGNVSFCTNYTSNQTAAKYIGLLQKYLCSYSKL